MTNVLKLCAFTMAVILWVAGESLASPQVVMQHDLTLRLEPSRHGLQAVDAVTVSNSKAPWLEFALARHMTIERVSLDDQPARFSFKKGVLRIWLPSAQAPCHLRIEYGGVFNDEVPDDPVNVDNPGFGVTGVIGTGGTMLLAGARWYPQDRDALSTYHIAVDAPEGVVAVTSGTALGHVTKNGRTLSRWKVAHPLRGLPLVAGAFNVSTRRFGSVMAATYFSAPLQHLSDGYLDATGRYLQFYQERFGAYPFGQFAVVENFFPTGYGFPSFTLMGRRVLRLPFIIHTSLGHEIAHCWWGNGVLVDSSQGNWSEGLTSYVADYLYKEQRGKGQSHRMQWLRNYAGLVDGTNDFPIAEFSSRVNPATKVVGYDKTAMVFHMLRRQVGEEAFWETLQQIYARYRFQAITWSDIQAVFEARSGLSLGPFMRQWVFQDGAPRLALAGVSIQESDRGFEVQGHVSQQAPYFDLPLDLALTTDHDTVTQRVQVSGARTPFSIATSRQPRQLEADPEVDIFRRLLPQEVPATINSIKGANSVAVVVARHLDAAGMAIARRLSAAMGLSKARIGREGDFAAGELDRNDLLFVGKPNRETWIPTGGQFTLTPEAFVLKGEAYGGNQASFFGVFPHPADKTRTAALFLPASPDLAQSLSTKIPHYGKYSYLVFKEARNQVKGTWNVERSPMRVRWPKPPTQ